MPKNLTSICFFFYDIKTQNGQMPGINKGKDSVNLPETKISEFDSN